MAGSQEILDGYRYEIEIDNRTAYYYNGFPLDIKFKVYSSTGYGGMSVIIHFKNQETQIPLVGYNYEDITVRVSDIAEWTGSSSVIFLELYDENSNRYLAEGNITVHEYLASLERSLMYATSELDAILTEKGITTNQNDGLLSLINKVGQIPSFKGKLRRLIDDNQTAVNIQSDIDLKGSIHGTRNSAVEDFLLDPSNYTFVEGGIINLTVTDGVINQTSRSVVIAKPPTDATKWVFTFKLQLTSGSRWFILFDKTTGSSYNSNYEYGLDVMNTGSPRCEFVGTSNGYNIPNTYADTDFPRKPSGYDEYIFFDFTLIRYDNNYIITWQPYNETYYNITIVPNTVGDSNLIGFWTWSGASFKIKDLEFYTL